MCYLSLEPRQVGDREREAGTEVKKSEVCRIELQSLVEHVLEFAALVYLLLCWQLVDDKSEQDGGPFGGEEG